MRQVIKETKEHLVFLHDDRGPNGMFLVCKRWYQKQIATYLSQADIFEDIDTTWDTVTAGLKEQLDVLGFEMGKGIVYTYGIWKRANSDTSPGLGHNQKPLRGPGTHRSGTKGPQERRSTT